MSAARDPVLTLFDESSTTPISPEPAAGVLGAPSVYLWGSSRSLVNLTLYALARRTDPGFGWLEVQSPGGSAPVDPTPHVGLSDPRMDMVTCRAEDLLSRGPMETSTMAKLVRLDGDPGELEKLQQFIALPAPVQAIAARLVPNVGPRVLAIANADHVAELYVRSPDALQEMIRALKESSVSVMLGRGDGRGPRRFLADYVFEVRAEDLRTWERGQLVCERAPDPGAMPAGRHYPLAKLPWAADVFNSARARAAE